MIPRLPAFPVLSAAILLSFLPCAAQDGAGVELRFLSFPRAAEPEPVELVIGEGKTIEVEIPSNELSPKYKVPRQASWAVGETIDGENGKPAFKTFGSTKALTSSKQLILLIRKGGTNADGFDVIPVDNQVSRFGGGKFLFMNTAKIDVGGVVGEVKFAIKPGRHIIITPKAQAGARTFHTALYYRKGDQTKNFFSSQWPANDQARGLIFFYHDPGTQRLRLHSIRSFL